MDARNDGQQVRAPAGVCYRPGEPKTPFKTLDGVNGQSTDGYYISPYTGTVAGNNQDIYCDDFNNQVNIGQTWTANVTNLATGNFGPTGTTRFGNKTDSLTVQGRGT